MSNLSFTKKLLISSAFVFLASPLLASNNFEEATIENSSSQAVNHTPPLSDQSFENISFKPQPEKPGFINKITSLLGNLFSSGIQTSAAISPKVVVLTPNDVSGDEGVASDFEYIKKEELPFVKKDFTSLVFPSTLSQLENKNQETLSEQLDDPKTDDDGTILGKKLKNAHFLEGLKAEQLRSMLKELEDRAQEKGVALSEVNLTESIINSAGADQLNNPNKTFPYKELPLDEKPCGSLVDMNGYKGAIYSSYIYSVKIKGKTEHLSGQKLVTMAAAGKINLNCLDITKVTKKNGVIVF